jgi:UDP-N-acetylmuramyl pentapeptide phosphotransferase/UDP-N-acetylglucosamine-1-phosphate transferase
MNALAFMAVVPGLIAWLLGLALSRSAVSRRLHDVPNERSLHESPTPRVGGIGIVAGALPLSAWLAGSPSWPAIGCAAVLALVSLVDDLRGLPAGIRLALHAIAAGVVLTTDPAPAAVMLAGAVAIVWSTNLFNFMDGADGLAGGMAAIGFAVLAAVAHASFPGLALACAALSSASVGFLLLNFPPARVFMGDAGSIPLGFLAAGFGWIGYTHDVWPAWFPLLVFSPFVADASVTLARRVWRHEPVWRAHRTHYYQRLVLSGWSRRRLALSAYALMIAAAASAVVALGVGGQWAWAIIACWTAIYAAAFFAIDRRAPPPRAR